MISSLNEYFSTVKALENGVFVPRLFLSKLGLKTGALLAQILYWTGPDSKGRSRLRVVKLNENKEREFWLAKRREDWREEIGLTAREYDSAVKELVELGVIEVRLFKFNGNPTNHIRIIESRFIKLLNEWMTAEKVDQNKALQ